MPAVEMVRDFAFAHPQSSSTGLKRAGVVWRVAHIPRNGK
jgi:hypothetical protein